MIRFIVNREDVAVPLPTGTAALDLEGLNPVQQAFVEEGPAQCGFCTPGFIV